jgi:hypothetical protein
MGAFGNYICEYCGASVFDLDDHECKVDDLKAVIRELKKEDE